MHTFQNSCIELLVTIQPVTLATPPAVSQDCLSAVNDSLSWWWASCINFLCKIQSILINSTFNWKRTMTILPAKRSGGTNSEENKETVQQTVCPCHYYIRCLSIFYCYRFLTCIVEQCRVSEPQTRRPYTNTTNTRWLNNHQKIVSSFILCQ